MTLDVGLERLMMESPSSFRDSVPLNSSTFLINHDVIASARGLLNPDVAYRMRLTVPIKMINKI